MPRNEPDEYRPGEPHGVAVIGMACRFPGAETPAQFWSNLVDGRESISREDGADGWIRASSTLADIDRFDAEFFGFSPREAALLDPQHRLFLEVCWEALEDGGAAGRRRVSDVGVYGGCGTSLYLMNNLSGEASRSKPNYLDSTEDLQLTMASDRDYLTSRVSYKLGFDGPSVNVQAACATSLYALHLACQALLAGECDMALRSTATDRNPVWCCRRTATAGPSMRGPRARSSAAASALCCSSRWTGRWPTTTACTRSSVAPQSTTTVRASRVSARRAWPVRRR
jgi:hypothetical protein